MALVSPQKSLLSLSRVSYSVAAVQLLDNISFDVRRGEILAIIGPNGAGKTSLLKVLGGELTPSQGDIFMANTALADWPLLARARSLAVLPQFSDLRFPFRVDEVVALGRIPHQTGVKIDNDIVDAAMAAMDIAYLKGRNYMALSGGEKQRTQLARVMAQIWREQDAHERVLLLDEPTMALDLGHQQQLMAAISAFAKQGIAVVMVMHDLNLAAQYADTLLALGCGRLVAYGAVNDVLTEELVRDLFQARVHVLIHPSSQKRVMV